MNSIDFQSIVATWRNFHAVSGIGHIKNEIDYDRMVDLGDCLVESGAAKDGGDLEELFLLVCDLIGQYDERHYPTQLTKHKHLPLMEAAP
ncbi:MAG: hypothetical protein RL748_2456 [Pseudomonadota bacterium]